MRLLPEIIAELQQEFDAKIAAEIGLLRAEQTIERAHKAEVVDLPQLPLRRRA